ncbi:MAG: hypothetical protein Q7J25_12210 [Vicinamibacterales bacterium]|nr:hypothetical protein [Vicinamibacterales bacterium]
MTDLEAVLTKFGLELHRGQTTWRWYGRFMNDWHDKDRAAALNGWKPEQFGKGAHAIGLAGGKGYEIGLIPRRDGKPGYELLYDAYGPGQQLEKAAGVGLKNLKSELAAQVTTRELARAGYRLARSVDTSGAITITATK